MRNKEIVFLILLIFTFSIVLILSILNLKDNIPIFDIGLSAAAINTIVLGFSFIGIIKTIWHLGFNY